MRKDEAFPAKFLKSSDLDDDLTVTIHKVVWEEVGKAKDSKPVLYFREKVKPWILNGTNFDLIVMVTGEDDSDEWDGKKITLYVTQVPFGKEMVDAIRVRVPKKAKGKAKASDAAADDNVSF